MPGNITSRTISAAVTPLVRKLAPMVASMATTALNLAVLSVLCTGLLIGVWWSDNHGVPESLLKTVAVAVVVGPCLFALLVVVEQVRLTYRQDTEIIYPTVEVFPDREPT